MEELGGKGAMGLVPVFADYPSSMTVESEWIVVVLEWKKTGLLIDEDVVDDESMCENPKKWLWLTKKVVVWPPRSSNAS